MAFRLVEQFAFSLGKLVFIKWLPQPLEVGRSPSTMHLFGDFIKYQILPRILDGQGLQRVYDIAVMFGLNPQAMQLFPPQGSNVPPLSPNPAPPIAQSRLTVNIDALGPGRPTVHQPGAVCDPMAEGHGQAGVSSRAQLFG
jgi:hypothetical protein